MVMGYDFNWSGSARAGGVAPIDSAYVLDVGTAMADYLAVVPASKIIWGVPYYGAGGRPRHSTFNRPDLRGHAHVHRRRAAPRYVERRRAGRDARPALGRDRPGPVVHAHQRRLRHLGPGLLRRRELARRQVRPHQRRRAARCRDLASAHGCGPLGAVERDHPPILDAALQRHRRLGLLAGHRVARRGGHHRRVWSGSVLSRGLRVSGRRWRASWRERSTCRPRRPISSSTTTGRSTRTTSIASLPRASPAAARRPASAPPRRCDATHGQLPGARAGPATHHRRCVHRRRDVGPRRQHQPSCGGRDRRWLRGQPVLPGRDRHPRDDGRLPVPLAPIVLGRSPGGS